MGPRLPLMIVAALLGFGTAKVHRPRGESYRRREAKPRRNLLGIDDFALFSSGESATTSTASEIATQTSAEVISGEFGFPPTTEPSVEPATTATIPSRTISPRPTTTSELLRVNAPHSSSVSQAPYYSSVAKKTKKPQRVKKGKASKSPLPLMKKEKPPHKTKTPFVHKTKGPKNSKSPFAYNEKKSGKKIKAPNAQPQPQQIIPKNRPSAPTLPDIRVQLDPYTLHYALDTTDIPTIVEVDEVVSVTTTYLEIYFKKQFSTLTSMETDSTGDRLIPREPYPINYTSTAIFSYAAMDVPSHIELEGALFDAFYGTNKATYLQILHDMGSENVFSTTTDVSLTVDPTSVSSFDTDEGEKSNGNASGSGGSNGGGSSVNSTALIASVTSASAVLACLVGAVLYLRRRRVHTTRQNPVQPKPTGRTAEAKSIGKTEISTIYAGPEDISMCGSHLSDIERVGDAEGHGALSPQTVDQTTGRAMTPPNGAGPSVTEDDTGTSIMLEPEGEYGDGHDFDEDMIVERPESVTHYRTPNDRFHGSGNVEGDASSTRRVSDLIKLFSKH